MSDSQRNNDFYAERYKESQRTIMRLRDENVRLRAEIAELKARA